MCTSIHDDRCNWYLARLWSEEDAYCNGVDMAPDEGCLMRKNVQIDRHIVVSCVVHICFGLWYWKFQGEDLVSSTGPDECQF